ncbi:TPA: hypothetical protein DDW35_02295 [Candidatus Sumerlaeota bacterium]|jgi:glycosyltransferase involved in cell wall biosynthesis|nr:hypothetical protein [Candidatus Sumerlaeota bacterium]
MDEQDDRIKKSWPFCSSRFKNWLCCSPFFYLRLDLTPTPILYLCPSDPTRTAIAEYARHFAQALRCLPDTETHLLLPVDLPESIDSKAARNTVRAFVDSIAERWNLHPAPLVHIEIGNALHREFWAGYYLQQALPDAQFFCTVHDPPKLTSNPYRYVHTEWEGRTPLRLLNVALTKGSELAVQWWKHRIERTFLQRCAGIFTLTEMGKRTLEAHPLFRGCPVHAIPHVFDPSGCDYPPPSAEPHPLRIALFCFLAGGKGIEELVEAFEQLHMRENLPPGRLHIFGGVGQNTASEKWLAALQDKIGRSACAARIELEAKFLTDAERDERLAKSDILVLPFKTVPVAFSSASALRALATGRPIVAAAANTIPEIIRHGENGLLYPENDPAALAENLAKLITDADLRQRLGFAAKQTLLERHTPESVAARVKVLLRNELPLL